MKIWKIGQQQKMAPIFTIKLNWKKSYLLSGTMNSTRCPETRRLFQLKSTGDVGLEKFTATIYSNIQRSQNPENSTISRQLSTIQYKNHIRYSKFVESKYHHKCINIIKIRNHHKYSEITINIQESP